MSYADLDGVPSQTAGVSSLLASDWNTYVRDNFDSIKFGHVVVADNTAKSAINAVEGIMVYQSDVDTLFLYTGSAWVPAVDTVSLVDSAVETAKINDLAVTTGKIDNLAVTEGKIAASAVTSAKIANDTIVNADVNTAAAIAYSKLNLATSIVNADISTSAAIAYSKLNLASSITSADIVDGTIVAGDISSTYPGHQVLTTTQKNALTGVTTGTMVFDSTLASVQVYNGSAWVEIADLDNEGGLSTLGRAAYSSGRRLASGHIESAASGAQNVVSAVTLTTATFTVPYDNCSVRIKANTFCTYSSGTSGATNLQLEFNFKKLTADGYTASLEGKTNKVLGGAESGSWMFGSSCVFSGLNTGTTFTVNLAVASGNVPVSWATYGGSWLVEIA